MKPLKKFEALPVNFKWYPFFKKTIPLPLFGEYKLYKLASEIFKVSLKLPSLEIVIILFNPLPVIVRVESLPLSMVPLKVIKPVGCSDLQEIRRVINRMKNQHFFNYLI